MRLATYARDTLHPATFTAVAASVTAAGLAAASFGAWGILCGTVWLIVAGLTTWLGLRDRDRNVLVQVDGETQLVLVGVDPVLAEELIGRSFPVEEEDL